MENIKSFKPIINANSKILILGSVPGVESLRMQQYYANNRNHFWKIVFSLYDLPIPEKYEDKVEFLQSKNIALWDVIEQCYREGSLDSNIKEEIPNDFSSLLKKYTNIKYIFFNGGKAYECFKKRVGFNKYENIIFTKLPSTSPAYTIPFENKIKQWNIIKE